MTSARYAQCSTRSSRQPRPPATGALAGARPNGSACRSPSQTDLKRCGAQAQTQAFFDLAPGSGLGPHTDKQGPRCRSPGRQPPRPSHGRSVARPSPLNSTSYDSPAATNRETRSGSLPPGPCRVGMVTLRPAVADLYRRLTVNLSGLHEIYRRSQISDHLRASTEPDDS